MKTVTLEVRSLTDALQGAADAAKGEIVFPCEAVRVDFTLYAAA